MGERIEEGLQTIRHFSSRPQVVMVGYPKEPFRQKNRNQQRGSAHHFRASTPKASHFSNVTHVYQLSVPHIDMPRNPSTHHQQHTTLRISIKRSGQLKETQVFLHCLNHVRSSCLSY